VLHHHRPLAGFRAGQPDRYPDDLLVHVDASDARMNDIHRHLLLRPPILRYGRAARGARNKIKIL
jgi:hypothetical protein